MGWIFEKNRPVIAAGILYTLTALIVVISAWAEDLHRFDLDLTISRYVGLRHWTAYFYMAVAVVMVTLVFIYLIRSGMHLVRKILYGAAFICVLGCALFPHNVEWSRTVSSIHNYFAYALMLFVTITIILMVIKAGTKSQRVLGMVAAAYAAYFIIAYVILDWEFFNDTIFLWENTFIYMLLGELMVEYRDSRLIEIFSKRFPFAGLAGFALTWIMYFLAPNNGKSIESLGPDYWNVIHVAGIILLISCIVFILSFITYMLYRPLSAKMKWPDVVLRIVITPAVMFAVVTGTVLTIFVISGAGY